MQLSCGCLFVSARSSLAIAKCPRTKRRQIRVPDQRLLHSRVAVVRLFVWAAAHCPRPRADLEWCNEMRGVKVPRYRLCFPRLPRVNYYDVRLISKLPWTVTVRGLDHQEILNVPLVTAGGVVTTSSGDAIAIMHQYAHLTQERTIHSCGQMEYNGLHACDRSAIAGGKQCIRTQDGHHIPLYIRDGLPYMTIRPFTDIEWETLPHIELTKAANGAHDLWLPTSIDHEHSNLLVSTNGRPHHPSAPLSYEFWDPIYYRCNGGQEHPGRYIGTTTQDEPNYPRDYQILREDNHSVVLCSHCCFNDIANGLSCADRV